MPSIRMLISGDGGLWRNSRSHADDLDLEESLRSYMGKRGEIIHEEEPYGGLGWRVSIRLFREYDVDSWIESLSNFLRAWGVPDGPMAFSIWMESKHAPPIFRRIEVPADSATQS